MPTDPHLVRLHPEDAGEVLTLQRAAYVDQARAHADWSLPPLVQGQAEIAGELADPAVLALGTREGARLVAAVRVRCADGVAELGRLIVAPDRQGAGLGSALLRAAEREVSARCTVIRLFTGEFSTGNLRLYQRHGYVEHRRSQAGHYQLVHLAKTLP
ncbi:GNAT family N-acetyltransferase [Sciscionella sediminilitoris]|uniref:GNAT family N-acetyltransferase n=1 Tax=Sciscionella sediminilitoris TaxID=1445613 RepID=UPI0004DF4C97|nr:GNAT family N-acetyltransferase [Sciscionella sp. SE31]